MGQLTQKDIELSAKLTFLTGYESFDHILIIF